MRFCAYFCRIDIISGSDILEVSINRKRQNVRNRSQAMKIPKIGIVGSGHIGGTIGTLLAKAGYEVFFSSRHPDRLKDLVKTAGPRARAGNVAEAIAFGDVIVLSLPLEAIPELDAETKDALKGKIVIDTSNPYPERDGQIAEEARRDTGGMGVFVARLLPGARIVRAFNTVYYVDLKKTVNKNGEKIGIPIAGDDQEGLQADRKSTRLNSSHQLISYAVFCLKKK